MFQPNKDHKGYTSTEGEHENEDGVIEIHLSEQDGYDRDLNAKTLQDIHENSVDVPTTKKLLVPIRQK